MSILVRAEDSLPGVKFIPLNSLTEAAVNQATEPASSSATSASYTAEALPQEDSAQTPYGLPRELMPLWDSLSIKQKAAQMVMVYLTSSQFIIENEIGGVLITGQHLRSAKRYLNTMAEIDSGLRIPLVVATDQEGGIVNRLASYSDTWRGIPSAQEMRRMDSTDIHSLANKIGSALKELKINMNLAPVLDPSKDSRGKNSFMEESRRSWGNDTTNAFKVRAFVKGMSENGVV
ncbi:glycoside hydrolase family 3 N-terminal domain-containing protein, partial [Fibrobacter sp.]